MQRLSSPFSQNSNKTISFSQGISPVNLLQTFIDRIRISWNAIVKSLNHTHDAIHFFIIFIEKCLNLKHLIILIEICNWWIISIVSWEDFNCDELSIRSNQEERNIDSFSHRAIRNLMEWIEPKAKHWWYSRIHLKLRHWMQWYMNYEHSMIFPSF